MEQTIMRIALCLYAIFTIVAASAMTDSSLHTKVRDHLSGKSRMKPHRKGRLLSRLEQFEVIELTDVRHYGRSVSGPELFSRTSSIYPERSELKFQTASGDFHLDVSLNHDLFAPAYTQERRSYDADGNLLYKKRMLDDAKRNNCHYRGEVQNAENHKVNTVAISSCGSGFSGFLRTDDVMLGIEPANQHMTPHELLTVKTHLQSSADREDRHLNLDKLNTLLELHGVSTDDVVTADEDDASHRTQKLSALGEVRALSEMYIVYHISHFDPESQAKYEDDGESTSLGSGICGHGLHARDAADNEHSHRDSHLQSVGGLFDEVIHQHAQTQSSDKYVELLVVNDNLWWSASSGAPEDDSAAIVNYVDAVYQAGSAAGLFSPLPRITLVSQLTFTDSYGTGGDPYTVAVGSSNGCASLADGTPCGDNEVNVAELLDTFHDWRASEVSLPNHDNGHLFSGYDFIGSVLGYAGVNVMCSFAISGGINMVGDTNFLDSRVVAHELGHNFGMNHDGTVTATASCPTSGFIMNAYISSPPSEFSDCSKGQYETYVSYYSCLDNVPTEQWGDPICQNGYVETGEECDCGQADCSSIDPCCNGTSCTLYASAVCSADDACCDSSTCNYADTSTLCRSASSECDIAEYCDGASASCPYDTFKGAGHTCTNSYGNGECLYGECHNHAGQCDKVGQQITGNSYGTCNNQEAYNDGNFCGLLYCSASGSSSCNSFQEAGDGVYMDDGVPCGDGKQCYNQVCTNSEELGDDDYSWVSTSWSTCPTCDTPQTRSTTCSVQNSDFSYSNVSDDYCSPDNKPSLSRLCVNDNLGCTHYSEENSLVANGREIAAKYGAVSKAEDLRSLVIRNSDYTSDFSTDSESDYWTGIKWLVLPGACMAMVGLISTISFCCRNSSLEDEYVDGEKDSCCDTRPRPQGYVFAEKCPPYLFLLIFVCFWFAFSVLGFFYNEELTAGATDENEGAVNLMIDLKDETLSFTASLADPLAYMNYTITNTVDDVTPVISDFNTRVQNEDAVTLLINELTDYDEMATEWSYNITISGYGTSSDLLFDCAWCQSASYEVGLVRFEVTEDVGAMQSSLEFGAQQAEDQLSDSQAQNDMTIQESNERIEQVETAVNENESDIDFVHDQVKYYDSFRRAFTALFCVFPLLGFLFGFLGIFCHWRAFYGYIYKSALFMMVLMGILFMAHLPFATCTGDSCIWLDKVEEDLTLWFEPDNAYLFQACLLGNSLFTALNITQIVNLTETYKFETVPNVTESFLLSDLKALQDDVDALTYATFGYNSSTLDNHLAILNNYTQPDVFTRSNVETCDETSYDTSIQDEIVQYRDQSITYLYAEQEFDTILAALSNNLTATRNTANEQRVIYSNLTDEFYVYEPDYEPIAESATALHEASYCNEIGSLYRKLKKSWCETIVVAFSFLALAFWTIGLVSPILVWTGLLSIKRMPDKENKVQDHASPGRFDDFD